MFVFWFFSPGTEKYIFMCPVHFHSNIQLFSQQTFSFKRSKEQMTERNKNLSVREAIWNFEDQSVSCPMDLAFIEDSHK